MMIHLKKLRAGRSLPSRKTWIGVDWKKTFLSLCLLTGLVQSTHPLSENTVYVGTFATGLGTALVTRYLSESNLLAIGAGAVSSFLAYQILNQFTPAGRLARARAKFDYIARSTLATREFNADEDFFNALNAAYVLSDLPLIAAFNDMAYLIQNGYDALSLLDAAKSESTFDLHIIQQCDILIPRIHHSLTVMTEAVRRIRASDEYIKQVKIYKEMQAAQEKLAVQKQIAHSQSQMAQAQMHQAYRR